ncbi:MAG: tetratricopeptide repeat protein [Pirellulales bacterium]|nr:tetratricopeptide repeat protein [Pirellulales bacterium]
MPAVANNPRWGTYCKAALVFMVLSGVNSWDLRWLAAEELVVAPLSALLPVSPDMLPQDAGAPSMSEEEPQQVSKEPAVVASDRLAKKAGLFVTNELREGTELVEQPVPTSRVTSEESLPNTDQSPQTVTLASRVELDSSDSEQGKLWVVQAHELASKATRESQLTQVIELCRKALATELEAEASAYTLRLSAWATNRRGELRVESGQEEESQADFELAVQQDPTCWKAIHNRGVSYAQIGMYREAFDDFCRTLELRPNHAKAYSNRGALYEQSGNLTSAIDDYRRAIELDPTLAFAHAGCGRASHHLRQYDVALAELDEAIRLAPENATFYKSRADLHADTGNYRAALEDYGRAVERNPLLAEAFRNGAWLLATCPDARFRSEENALESAEKAMELTCEDRHLYLDTLAAAQANAGRFDEAVQTAEMAIEEAPDSYRSYYEARHAIYQQGKPFRTRPVH